MCRQLMPGLFVWSQPDHFKVILEGPTSSAKCSSPGGRLFFFFGGGGGVPLMQKRLNRQMADRLNISKSIYLLL